MTVSLLADGTNLVNQLLVGGLDPSNAVRYVKNAGEPFIYGVPPAATDQIPSSYARLRAHRIFDLKPGQITKLEAGNVTVARDAQGKWQLVAPAQGVLDADSVQHLLDMFCQLRAEEFTRPKTDEDAGLGTTIRVTVGDATHWLAIAKGGEAAADVSELSFQLAPAVVQTLTKDLVATPVVAPASSP